MYQVTKTNRMKNLFLLLILLTGVMIFTCCKKEEEEPEPTPYELLTGHVWVSDSLLANGVEAGGSGQLLEKFNGDAAFRADGTGTFGEFSGTWVLSADNKELTITTTELTFPILAQIVELTKTSLKITTGFPDPFNPPEVIAIRMTFNPKV